MVIREDGVMPRHAKIVMLSPENYGIIDGNYAEDGNATSDTCYTQLYIRKGKLRNRISIKHGDSFIIGRGTAIIIKEIKYKKYRGVSLGNETIIQRRPGAIHDIELTKSRGIFDRVDPNLSRQSQNFYTKLLHEPLPEVLEEEEMEGKVKPKYKPSIKKRQRIKFGNVEEIQNDGKSSRLLEEKTEDMYAASVPDVTQYQTPKDDKIIEIITFIIKQKDEEPLELKIEPKGLPIYIGCGHDCHVIIKDDRASKSHVKLYSEDGEIWWEDLAVKPSISSRMNLTRLVLYLFLDSITTR